MSVDCPVSLWRMSAGQDGLRKRLWLARGAEHMRPLYLPLLPGLRATLRHLPCLSPLTLRISIRHMGFAQRAFPQRASSGHSVNYTAPTEASPTSRKIPTRTTDVTTSTHSISSTGRRQSRMQVHHTATTRESW